MSDNRKIAIITGAHGFIGQHVARHLSSRGWRVIGIGHGAWASLQEQEQWGISKWHLSDLTVDALHGCAIVPSAIVHCAGSGSVGFSRENPKEDFERNVGTTLNVLEYARRYAPAARIVTLSSAGVYGDVERLPITEDAPLNPVSPYGVHKKVAEEICKSYADHYGLSITVLRLFSVYGAGLKKQLLWDACSKISRGDHTFFGTGNEVRDWIHVSDVASLVERAIARSVARYCVYNGATGVGVSVAEILGQLFRGLGKVEFPSFSGLAKRGDPAGYVADIGRARGLDWQPSVAWQQGVADYATWFDETL